MARGEPKYQDFMQNKGSRRSNGKVSAPSPQQQLPEDLVGLPATCCSVTFVSSGWHQAAW